MGGHVARFGVLPAPPFYTQGFSTMKADTNTRQVTARRGKGPVRRWLRAGLAALATLWIALGIALAFVVGLEAAMEKLAFQPRLYTRAELEPLFPGMSDEFYSRFAYEMQQTCFKEASVTWYPFCYTRNTPFRGQYINVDSQGLRKTWNPRPQPGRERPKIFFFGGSAMWGWGNRDEFTIPSLVARQLAQQGLNVEAVNLAQRAYVSTQNAISLLQELQRGNVPRLVVFCDGFNDIASSYANQVTGVSLFERDRARDFNVLRQHPGPIFKHAAANTVIGRVLHSYFTPDPLVQAPRRWKSRQEMARATAQAYVANVRLTEALAKSFGFDALYCWQPCVYVKRSLSPLEERIVAEMGPKMAEIWQACYAETRALRDRSRRADIQNAPRLLYLADLFNTPAWDRKTAFIDRAHMCEEANAVIAREIAAWAAPYLAARESKPGESAPAAPQGGG
jgi:lysophospholipase L1-like esterase